MNKGILLLFILIFSINMVYSNDDVVIKNQLNLSYSTIKLQDDYYLMDKKMPSLSINYQRQLNNIFDVGTYFGFGLYDELDVSRIEEPLGYTIRKTFVKVSNSFKYGLNSKLHILPLTNKTSVSRADLYVLISAGIKKLNSSNNLSIIPVAGNYFDGSVMAGLTFYLSSKFGLTAEVGYKYFKYRKGINAQYGLSYRF